MKKTIRSTLLCAILFLLAVENFAQMTANAQQLKSSASEKKVTERKLKDVLTDLKDHYNVDILFFDRYIEEYSVSNEMIRWDKPIEKNLEAVLKSTNLEFKKTKKGGYVISPKRTSESEVEQDNGFQKTGNQTTSASSEQTSVVPNTILQILGTILVSGVVKDESGQPLPGTNVIQKGTTNGTTTDAEGKYSLNVPDDATLVFSFIGYATIEEAVGNRSTIDVSLKSDATSLNEIVVTGYGELRKADVTSAQSSISAKDISRTVNTTLDQALQGRAPGVYVTQNTGAPGGGVSVNIRGVNSLSGTNEPLYVVDGVQIQGGTSTTGTNPMSTINPTDIENVEILQGPSATAIYGSRGTNGVVLITTKRGKSGNMKIAYEFSYSLQNRPKNLDVMNLQQYAQMNIDYFTATNNAAKIREDFKDPSLLGAGTDWQKALFQQAAMSKHQISFSGGSDKSSYYLSGERMMQDGIGPNSGFNRTSVRLNMDNKPREWLSIGTNIMLSQTDQKLGTLGSNLWSNLVLNAVQLAPDIPVKNMDGTYAGGNTDISSAQQFSPPNPVGLASIVTNEQTTRTLIGGLSLGIKIIKGLDFRTNLNTNIGYTNSTLYNPTYKFGYQTNDKATLQNQTNLNTYWVWNQMLTYQRDVGRHHINAMATHESQESYWKNLMGQRTGFQTNNILDLNVGDPDTQANGGGQGTWSMESYLGRINYNFDNRYIVTGAIRADGSANFGPANHWGYFPSVSAAYRISNEKFFNVQWINDLRLRVETGLTGSQGNGGAAIYGTLRTGPSEWGTSFAQQKYSNPNFKWEQTQTNNFGLTFGLFGGRVQLDADYYIRTTDNLIMPQSYPYYMGTYGAFGIQAPVVNIGSMGNKGWSVSINTININNNGFKWESNLNISAFKTTITKLTSQSGQLTRTLGSPKNNTPFVQRSVVGEAPWQFVGNIQQGVFQSIDDVTNSARPAGSDGVPFDVAENSIWVGDAKYKDINNDGKIDENDITFIGNPWPKAFGGFTNNFSYKGIELSILLTASFGNQIYNLMRDEQMNPNNINTGRNMFVDAGNFAKLAKDQDGNPYLLNPGTSVPRALGASGVNNNFGRYTSTYVEDGSYVRIKNISVNYSLPASLIGRQKIIQGVRLGVSAQNLFTFTNYKGYDPEVGAYVGPSYNGDTMIGLDYGRYPLTRFYSFNVKVEF